MKIDFKCTPGEIFLVIQCVTFSTNPHTLKLKALKYHFE